MSSSAMWKFRGAAITIALTVLVALVAQPAAGKVFKLKDLNGAYRFIVSEIRVAGPDVQYCSSHGVIEFDGAGSATTLSPLRSCVLHPAGTASVDVDDPGDFHYEVFPNGEVLLIELDDLGAETDYVTHGRILQKGNLLLFDNTASLPHHPEFLLTTAVAAKE